MTPNESRERMPTLNIHGRNIDDQQARTLAMTTARLLGAKAKRFEKGLSSLDALYRVSTIKDSMKLQIHVGDCIQTTWVQNFALQEPFSTLAFSANQPERAAALVNRGDAGLSMPIFFNDYLYCGPELIRRFCQENGRDIEALHLQDGERFSVQRGQLRLRLVTDSPERMVTSLEPVGRIFHRYVRG